MKKKRKKGVRERRRGGGGTIQIFLKTMILNILGEMNGEHEDQQGREKRGGG